MIFESVTQITISTIGFKNNHLSYTGHCQLREIKWNYQDTSSNIALGLFNHTSKLSKSHVAAVKIGALNDHDITVCVNKIMFIHMPSLRYY